MIILEVSRDSMKVVKNYHKLKKFKIFKIGIFLFFVTCILTFVICMLLTPKIELTDSGVLKVPVGASYEEVGYQAYANNRDISDKVIIKGEVDTTKLGTYILTYEVKYFLFSTKKLRIVEVVDGEAPNLELIGEKEVFICPKSTYQEEGYLVSDNYDKDLTSKVRIEDKENIRYYEVIDSSGNKTIKERVFHYEDKEKPVIKLNGSNKVYVYKNQEYKDLGYQVTDNCDGDITSKVKVTNPVNTNKLGTYKITYQVFDSSLNEAKVTRLVQVIERSTNQNGVIYLTFDDGPSKTITSSVLDILKEEGVQATFFVINHSDDLNYLIKREYEEGHTVGLHGYTHNYAQIYQSKDNYFNDLEKIQEKVKRITGETSKIIRFPGGSSNTISKKYKQGIMSELTREVIGKGYRYFDWNVGSGDAGDVKSSDEVYQNVISGLSYNKANIVLMHDFENNYYTLNALRDIIQYGKDNGYTFKKITMDTTMVTHRVTN